METYAPIGQAERHLAHAEQRAGGVELITHLVGFGGTSTRAELAAAIVALSSDLPVHLGTDSRAFKLKAEQVHELVKAERAPRRPWQTQCDGDLWELYHRCVVANGEHAIRISKVKGHATWEMVKKGQVRDRDKWGNDEADAAAERAVHLFAPAMVKVGARLAARQARYTQLLVAVHDHLLRAYHARGELMREAGHTNFVAGEGDQRQNTKLTQMVKASLPPTEGPFNSHHYLTPILPIHACSKLLACPGAAAIYDFLRNMLVKRLLLRQDHRAGERDGGEEGGEGPGEGAAGTTWIELFILFRMAGHAEPLPADARTAKARPTLGVQLGHFRRLVRRVVAQTFSADAAAYFRGGAFRGQRLRCLGVGTHLSVMPFRPGLTKEVEEQVAIQTIRSQRHLSLKLVQQALEKGQPLEVRRIGLRGRAKWLHQVRPWKRTSTARLRSLARHRPHLHHRTHRHHRLRRHRLRALKGSQKVRAKMPGKNCFSHVPIVPQPRRPVAQPSISPG